MNNSERFEQLWNDYLEGELNETGIAELQQLFASDDGLLRAAADSFQVHRLLGLNAADSESRHEHFVRATMVKLPANGTEFVDDVMQKLPVPAVGKPSRQRLFSGVVAVAALLMAFFLFSKTSATPALARVTGLHGSVQWTGEGGIIQDVNVGHVLRGGTLETRTVDAWADLQFRDGSTVTVSGRSLLTLSEREQKIVHLRYGSISADVAPQPTGRPMLVHTPAAELKIIGTQFNVDAQHEGTRLVVNEGRVRIKRIADGKEVDVDAQHEIMATMENQNGLMPAQRAEANSVWKSDLQSEVVHGKWVPETTKLALELKKAVASGEMTKAAAMDAYKDAVTLDDSRGTVWAMPTYFGSLVLLSVSTSSGSPVAVSRDGSFRIRGRLHGSADVEFGVSVYAPNGGFAGKFSKTVTAAEFSSDDGTFAVFIPIGDFKKDSSVGDVLVGHELRDWWCLTKGKRAKLEIISVELCQE